MINDNEVKKIAKLAKLNFSPEELAIYVTQLNNIIDMIDIFQEVDCTNIQPLTSVCNMDQRMKKDEVIDQDISDQLFSYLSEEKSKLAQNVKYYIVPKVVE